MPTTHRVTRSICRRNLLGLLTVGPAGSLAVACGRPAPAPRHPEPAPTAPASGQAAATAKPAAQAAPAAAGASKIKVRFWYGLGGQLGEVIVGQINKFNAAQNNVEVEAVLQQSYEGVQEKFLATLVGGDVPELIQMEIHATPQFASAGALAPMEQFYANDAAFNFDDLVPATLLNQRWEGKLYAMPINRSTPLLYYNKNLFKAGRPRSREATQDLDRVPGDGQDPDQDRGRRDQDRRLPAGSPTGGSSSRWSGATAANC